MCWARGTESQTLTSCELVISTMAAKRRVLSCECMSIRAGRFKLGLLGGFQAFVVLAWTVRMVVQTSIRYPCYRIGWSNPLQIASGTRKKACQKHITHTKGMKEKKGTGHAYFSQKPSTKG